MLKPSEASAQKKQVLSQELAKQNLHATVVVSIHVIAL